MGMDVRLPIGGMFLIIGVILGLYGLFTAGDPMYDRSLSLNINLWWGLSLAVFGGIFLVFARTAHRVAAVRSAPPAVEDIDRNTPL